MWYIIITRKEMVNKMKQEELIERLNQETKAKLNAQEEYRRFEKEIEELEKKKAQAYRFISNKTIEIRKITEELRRGE